jgi:tRNA threonylcarbamoyl adenosine modification protein (Sua5/YciO/YrdC/YwlC family)
MSLVFNCADPVERAEGLETAVDSIRRGELVVMPVDASYGLAADAFQPAAVDALAATKGRGRDLPIPVMVGSWGGLDGLTLIVQPAVRALVEAFWPGPLTLVIEHAPSLAWDLGDDRGTVSIRMPLHPVALELLARTGPLAVSGANLTGKRVPLTVSDAQEQLGYAVAVYLDSGMCIDPAPSTIVDVSGAVPTMLRPGQVTLRRLQDVVPELVEGGRPRGAT